MKGILTYRPLPSMKGRKSLTFCEGCKSLKPRNGVPVKGWRCTDCRNKEHDHGQ